jgi:phosphoserine phosphatase RsbU/P
MSLAGELQWKQLPPLSTATTGLDAAGILEPAYDVSGDGFDYSSNDDLFDLAIVDAVGHDLSAALLSSVVLASLRHSRRHGIHLTDALSAADDAVLAVFHDMSYATAQLAQVHIPSGRLLWVNAGHPLPLLVRRGRVIGEQLCPARAPLGLGRMVPRGADVRECTVALEPGDRVLFYSDGVIEGGQRGSERFGLARLIDLLERADHDGLDCAETVRRVTQAVLGHAKYELRDDSTLVLVEWHRAG